MKQTARRHRIVLTGGSGVLGRALLPLLAPHEVVCLTHSGSRPAPISIRGDIAGRWLGLPLQMYGELASWATVVVNLAAVTDFRHPDIERTNLEGARNVARFAEQAEAHLVHVSTAFVGTGGGVTEGPRRYATSKFLAEGVVRAAACRSTIVRPSIVIGDSRSGQISRYQGVYKAAGALLEGRLPIAPFEPSWLLDVIPQDVVARALVAVLDGRWADETVWVTSGDRALTLDAVCTSLVGLAATRGTPVPAPRFVAPDLYERLIAPALLDPMPPDVRRSITGIMDNLAAYISRPEPFPTSVPDVLDVAPHELPDLPTAFLRCMTRWADERAEIALAS